MRIVLQRVSRASVDVDGERVGSIGNGLLLLLGVAREDTQADADKLAEKICHLRVFEDEHGKMNRSVQDVDGAVLVVSQFTLLGDCRKGRRPSFIAAAAPDLANQLYQYFADAIRQRGVHVETGTFQAHMDVAMINDGPVTLVLEP